MWWKPRSIVLKEDLTVTSNIGELNTVLQWFDEFYFRNQSQLSWLTNRGKRQYLPLDEIKLALDEGFVNAVKHAHENLPPETPIELQLAVWDDRLEIRIWDQGEPFDPNSLKEPELGKLRNHGFGWYLIRRLTDKVDYLRCEDDRNCLLLAKYKH